MNDGEDKEIRITRTEDVTETSSPPPGESAGPVSWNGPTWKGWVISIITAVVLSAAATLLLGGSFSPHHGTAASSEGCRVGGGCCPPLPDK